MTRYFAMMVAGVLLGLAVNAEAQTAGQWVFQKKNTGAGATLYGVTGTNGRAFGLDGSGNLVMLEVGGGGGGSVAWGGITGTLSAQTDLQSALNLKAPLASPTFTGTVTIPSGASIAGYLTTVAGDAAYQPLDGDLTSIAALSTQSYGRGLLTQADAAAARSTLGLGTLATQSATITDYLTTAAAALAYQPLDGDLTSIAALSTTSYGRGLLTQADAAAARSTLGLGSVENTALSTWTGSTNVTTLGTISAGTWQGTAIANAYLANSALTIAGTSVSLGGSITASAILDAIGSTRGAVLYRGASGWAALSPGTSGYFLKSNGAGADPAWAEASGGGGGGKVAQVVVTTSGTTGSTNATIPIDNTPPTDSEGTAFSGLDTTFTPTNASSTLVIEVELMIGAGATSECIAALFEDGTTDALRAAMLTVSSQWTAVLRFRHTVSAGSTSARTYKIRYGVQSGGGMFINSNYSVYTNRLFGAAGISSLTVTEILP